jgi:hypothetical protein
LLSVSDLGGLGHAGACVHARIRRCGHGRSFAPAGPSGIDPIVAIALYRLIALFGLGRREHRKP